MISLSSVLSVCDVPLALAIAMEEALADHRVWIDRLDPSASVVLDTMRVVVRGPEPVLRELSRVADIAEFRRCWLLSDGGLSLFFNRCQDQTSRSA